MTIRFTPGKYASFQYGEHSIDVIITEEFAKRVTQRSPKLDRLDWLLREGIKEALDVLISMPGTKSIQCTLRTKKSKIHVPVILERLSTDPRRIIASPATVYVGEFSPYETDYPFTFENPATGTSVIFERDYEPELMQAVMDDLEPRHPNLRKRRGYHFMTRTISYIAEVEPARRAILIPDARWHQETYIFEFEAA